MAREYLFGCRGRVRSCLAEMLNLGCWARHRAKVDFFAYSTQFVFLRIRLVLGNVVTVAIDMCKKSPITGEWIYGITWKHVYFNISVLSIVDITSILKLMFPTAYCFCLDGHLGGCVVDIIVAVVAVVVVVAISFFIYFVRFLIHFWLFIYLFFPFFLHMFLSFLPLLSALLLLL